MLHFLFCEHRERFLQGLDRTVMAALPQHKDIFRIVFNDCARLIRLSIETGSVSLGLHRAVCDFLPKDRREAIQAEASCADLNIGMQRHYVMPASALPGDTDIAYYAADSSARREDTGALLPDFVEFGQEMFVVFDVSELRPVSGGIFFQGPIRRGRDDEVHRRIGNPGKVPRIAEPQTVAGLIERGRPWDGSEVRVGLTIGA